MSLSIDLLKTKTLNLPEKEIFKLYITELSNNIKYFVCENFSFFLYGDNLQDVYDNIKKFTIETMKTELKNISEILNVVDNPSLYLTEYLQNTNIKSDLHSIPIFEIDSINRFDFVLLEKTNFLSNINLKEIFVNIRNYSLSWLITTILYLNIDYIFGLFQEIISDMKPNFYYYTGINSMNIADHIRNGISIMISILLSTIITRKINNKLLSKVTEDLNTQSLELIILISNSKYKDNYNDDVEKINVELNKCIIKSKEDEKISFICFSKYHTDLDNINSSYFNKLRIEVSGDELAKLNKVFSEYKKKYINLHSTIKSLISGEKLS